MNKDASKYVRVCACLQKGHATKETEQRHLTASVGDTHILLCRVNSFELSPPHVLTRESFSGECPTSASS